MFLTVSYTKALMYKYVDEDTLCRRRGKKNEIKEKEKRGGGEIGFSGTQINIFTNVFLI